MKEAASLLDPALWKMKMAESSVGRADGVLNNLDYRHQCRMRSRPCDRKRVAYLLPANVQEDSEDEHNEDGDDDGSDDESDYESENEKTRTMKTSNLISSLCHKSRF